MCLEKAGVVAMQRTVWGMNGVCVFAGSVGQGSQCAVYMQEEEDCAQKPCTEATSVSGDCREPRRRQKPRISPKPQRVP